MRLVGLVLLVAFVTSRGQLSPLYTLSVNFEGQQKELVLYPGQEPADAVAAFVFDHSPKGDDPFEALLGHLCDRFPCGRKTARPVLFPLDLTLPKGRGPARAHVHDGDEADAAGFARGVAARFGFVGADLEGRVARAVAGEAAARQGRRYESGDPFVVLGVDRSADSAAVRRAYRSESVKWHPDKATMGNGDRFLQITRAYEAIGDDGARRAFLDAEAARLRPPPPPPPRFVVPRDVVLSPGTVLYFTW